MKEEESHNDIALPTGVKPKQSVVMEMILWWEKRRIVYNVFVIGLSVFLIYHFWDCPWRTIVGGDVIIFDAIVFIMTANVFYTLTWGLGALNHYLYKVNGLENRARWILFIVGTLVSIVITDIYFVFTFDVLFAGTPSKLV